MKQSITNYCKTEIKKHIHLENIIPDYLVNVKRNRVDVGYIYENCPFCEHKNHFQIDIGKNLYNSFSGCCKGGDVIKFVQEVDGIGFKDAIESLGNRFNLNKSEYKRTQSKRELEILTLLAKHQDQAIMNEVNRIFDFLTFMEYDEEFWKCISLIGTPELPHYIYGLKGRYEI